ncbi:MAG TPA: HIT family protein [Mycobacteriales bacterium]|nr:HIT family protein [Mycobacteriales bacterium]
MSRPPAAPNNTGTIMCGFRLRGCLDGVMFNHEPPDYHCPFCLLASGGADGINNPRTIVARTDQALAVVSPRWWPRNHGHVLVVPTGHFENLYDIPTVAGHAVHDLVRQVARAMRRSYSCSGISTRQHNEPDGNQDVWHYHVHVFPRYPDDRLYESAPYAELVSVQRRIPYAEKLRAAWGDAAPDLS